MKIQKVLLTVVALLAVAIGANAQINVGALKNKVTNKVKQEVSNKVNKAVDSAIDGTKQKAEQTVENAATTVTETVTAKAGDAVAQVVPQSKPKVVPPLPKPEPVTVKSNIDDVYAAYWYYQKLVEEAIELKDVSYLCSIDAQKPFDLLYKVIQEHPQKNASTVTNNSEAYAQMRYKQTAKPKMELIGEEVYSKNPDPFQKYLENMSWYLGKINETDDLNIQGYHLANALAVTSFAMDSKDKYMTPERIASPEYQAVAGRFQEVWDNMSPEYKEYYKHLDGVTSIDGAAAAKARLEAQWAAEAKAVKEANLENIKNSLEPVPESKWEAGPNPQLEAQCLALAQKGQPNVTFVKAVLMSPDWQYDYQWGNPVSRRVHAWLIFKMTNGYYKAIHYSFKQMNTGGGNYDALKVYGMYSDDFKYVQM